MSNSLNPTGRFSSRVADYVKYRPDYPRQILDILSSITGLLPDWIVADIGCGTGISSRMFLENGNEVFGVEPNDDMRKAAEEEFVKRPNFHPVKGTAEQTNLPDQSMDLIICAQAFHWFDKKAMARECRRVLQPAPGGWVAVMWNTRQTNTLPFARQYDQLLTRYGTDYKEVAHRTPMSIEDFTGIFGVSFQREVVPNYQSFDLDGLLGRVRSSSYTPQPGQAGYDELFNGMHELFERHQENGAVRFDYETELFLGKVQTNVD
ncbi:MAG TPA: class I SAM-dependent methyltransferase [Tepidisphaeraceae bacterium]|nr:class I SAM-dependent methyltransferase [Tepidisphaeraceae bacterium]